MLEHATGYRKDIVEPDDLARLLVVVTAYPAELLGLLGPPAERGPLTLRPSIAVSEEYDDNVLLDTRRVQTSRKRG